MRVLLAVLIVATVATPALAANKYPSAMRKVYIASCSTGEDAASPAYCECSLAELEKRWDLPTFMKKMEMTEAEIFEDEDFGDAMAACVQHI